MILVWEIRMRETSISTTIARPAANREIQSLSVPFGLGILIANSGQSKATTTTQCLWPGQIRPRNSGSQIGPQGSARDTGQASSLDIGAKRGILYALVRIGGPSKFNVSQIVRRCRPLSLCLLGAFTSFQELGSPMKALEYGNILSNTPYHITTIQIIRHVWGTVASATEYDTAFET